MITHEMEVVKQICDKVALIDGGQLVETADVNAFFTAPVSALGKQFVAQTQRFDLPEDYQVRLKPAGTHPVVKIGFLGHHIDEPVLSSLTKRFGVNISIIQAKIEHIGSSTRHGLLVAEIIGEPGQTRDALAYLTTQPVSTEILGYVE